MSVVILDPSQFFLVESSGAYLIKENYTMVDSIPPQKLNSSMNFLVSAPIFSLDEDRAEDFWLSRFRDDSGAHIEPSVRRCNQSLDENDVGYHKHYADHHLRDLYEHEDASERDRVPKDYP